MSDAVSRERVASILDSEFGDRVYTVEANGTVWVSGMNAYCASVGRRMAKTLAHAHDIPAGLVYDDDAVQHGGVQFHWGEVA